MADAEQAAREAVAALPRAQHVALDQVSLQLEYHYHDAFKRLVVLHEAEIIEAVYGTSVRFSLRLPAFRMLFRNCWLCWNQTAKVN